MQGENETCKWQNKKWNKKHKEIVNIFISTDYLSVSEIMQLCVVFISAASADWWFALWFFFPHRLHSRTHWVENVYFVAVPKSNVNTTDFPWLLPFLTWNRAQNVSSFRVDATYFEGAKIHIHSFQLKMEHALFHAIFVSVFMIDEMNPAIT